MSFRPNFTIVTNSVSSELAGFLDALKDTRPILKAMGDELLDITIKNFGPSSHSERPAEWPELTAKYMHKIQYFGPPKLVLNQTMVDSFRIYYQGNSAFLTNDADYADIHQFGGENNVPARPYYPVDEQGSELTDYAKFRVLEAAEFELRKMMGLGF